MASEPAPLVAFDGVYKKFRKGQRHTSLRSLIPSVTRSMLGSESPRREEFWALRDVSFEVGAGQVLGVIGANGAGKSTVLKLLTGILRPSRGRIVVRGRIGALIELAAGFHSELTGRENVYLQGAIMGMARAEVARRFEEIVEFAGLADFIDTPVKRYSSGMSARLGFSIAAHTDPDILLIDEVLAVGDLAFQRKAFSRLEEIVHQHIPVVIVSHQLNRITEMCDHAILLTRGEIVLSGSPAKCVAAYVGEALSSDTGSCAAPVRVTGLSDPCPVGVRSGQRVRLRLEGTVTEPDGGANTTVGLRVRALPQEELVFITHSAGCGVVLPHLGAFELEVDLQMNVGPGIYRAQAVVWDLTDKSERMRGPSTVIEVEREPSAIGSVYPHPRMRLLAP